MGHPREDYLYPKKCCVPIELPQTAAQAMIIAAFGTVDFDPDYDYKAGAPLPFAASPEPSPKAS